MLLQGKNNQLDCFMVIHATPIKSKIPMKHQIRLDYSEIVLGRLLLNFHGKYTTFGSTLSSEVTGSVKKKDMGNTDES